MQGLLLLFLIFFTSSYANEVAQPPACFSKNYTYTGPYYSDSYQMPEKNGLQSCHARKAIDAVKLGEQHKTNRELISAQINKMLNNPGCKDVHPELIEYQEKLKKQKDKTEQAFKVVVAWFETIKHRMDIQRQWAYSAAYNAACSSERNSESSFIDLDTINKILSPAEATTITVTENNQLVEDCSDVKAHGSADLIAFKVSMKKAKGADFQFQWDPYGVPDQVILKTQNGSVLFDSGCKGSQDVTQEDLNVKVPLGKLSGEKNIFVTINNNCSDPHKTKNASSWELSVKCAQDPQEPPDLCVVPKQELAGLLIQEINYYKTFMNANVSERHCLEHFDEHILKAMEAYGMFIIEGGTKTNGFCESLDEMCLSRQIQNALDEKPIPPRMVAIPERVPSTIPDTNDGTCTVRPDESESILKLISWNYCSIGKQKLGLE